MSWVSWMSCFTTAANFSLLRTNSKPGCKSKHFFDQSVPSCLQQTLHGQQPWCLMFFYLDRFSFANFTENLDTNTHILRVWHLVAILQGRHGIFDFAANCGDRLKFEASKLGGCFQPEKIRKVCNNGNEEAFFPSFKTSFFFSSSSSGSFSWSSFSFLSFFVFFLSLLALFFFVLLLAFALGLLLLLSFFLSFFLPFFFFDTFPFFSLQLAATQKTTHRKNWYIA